MIWLALGASDLRGGIDILLAQVLRGFAGAATKPVTTSQPSSRRACQGVTGRKCPPSFPGTLPDHRTRAQNRLTRIRVHRRSTKGRSVHAAGP